MEVEVVHSNSVLTAAIGESGLDFYRFGAIATIPKWSAHYTPVSFYETLQKNMSEQPAFAAAAGLQAGIKPPL